MKKIIKLIDLLIRGIDYCSPVVDFAVRFCVAIVFWRSGLVKFSSMDSTIWLFTHEYQVPILSPILAAYFSTIAELLFSGLLIIGLLGRVSAFILFAVNVVAVISYPDLHDAAVQWHMIWGLLLLVPLFHGPGKLSFDYWIWEKLRGQDLAP